MIEPAGDRHEYLHQRQPCTARLRCFLRRSVLTFACCASFVKRENGQCNADGAGKTKKISRAGCAPTRRRARFGRRALHHLYFSLTRFPQAGAVKSDAEAHVPTESPPPRKNTWIPAAHEDQERAGRAVAAPRQGTPARLGEPRPSRLARWRVERSPQPMDRGPASGCSLPRGKSIFHAAAGRTSNAPKQPNSEAAKSLKPMQSGPRRGRRG
jgi:hypothetical protein